MNPHVNALQSQGTRAQGLRRELERPEEPQLAVAAVQYQDLRRFTVPKGFRGRSKVAVQLWWCVQASVFRWSPQFLYGARRGILRAFGAKIGRGVLIRPSAKITYPWFLSIGDYSWVGDDTVIYNLAQVNIGENVAVSHRVYLCTGTHDTGSVLFDIAARGIDIEDQAWLANDCFISPGVTIGQGAVIAARSTVLDDMPGGMLCAGAPCRVLRPRRAAGAAPTDS